jgi:hypothetical protein
VAAAAVGGEGISRISLSLPPPPLMADARALANPYLGPSQVAGASSSGSVPTIEADEIEE